jgi:hypothetical protein
MSPWADRGPRWMCKEAATRLAQWRMWWFVAVVYHLRSKRLVSSDTCYLTEAKSTSCFCLWFTQSRIVHIESSYDQHRRTTLYAGTIFSLRPSDNSAISLSMTMWGQGKSERSVLRMSHILRQLLIWHKLGFRNYLRFRCQFAIGFHSSTAAGSHPCF